MIGIYLELFGVSGIIPVTSCYRKLQVGTLGYIGLLEGFYKVYRP